MRKAFTLLTAILITEFVCGQQFQQQYGLYYEVADSINRKNKDFFNLDNNIYTPGREFIYSCQIIKNGDTLGIKVNQSGDTKTQSWSFVKETEIDTLTIRYLSFKVQSGYGGLDNIFPDYSQTVIEQKYYSAYEDLLFDGSTGLIENKKNIWLHPFRGKYFSVLEFSPFPYVKFPLQVGKMWTWQLDDISERWSDERIVKYQGKQQASYVYKVVGKKKIKSALGIKECYVTEATATTKLGLTRLTSFFNPQLGFIMLQYSNIDGSTIRLELINIKDYR
jgi:hypothetical protein